MVAKKNNIYRTDHIVCIFSTNNVVPQQLPYRAMSALNVTKQVGQMLWITINDGVAAYWHIMQYPELSISPIIGTNANSCHMGTTPNSWQ